MADTPRALARWRAHLEEEIGVEDAAAVVDPFARVDWGALEGKVDRLDQRVTLVEQRLSQLEVRVSRVEDQLTELRTDMKELRHDLLRVTGAQFFALIAAVAAIVGLA